MRFRFLHGSALAVALTGGMFAGSAQAAPRPRNPPPHCTSRLWKKPAWSWSNSATVVRTGQTESTAATGIILGAGTKATPIVGGPSIDRRAGPVRAPVVGTTTDNIRAVPALP